MAFPLAYRIDRQEGLISGDLPSVLHDFTALIATPLGIIHNSADARPPSVVELGKLISSANRDISFRLNYAT